MVRKKKLQIHFPEGPPTGREGWQASSTHSWSNFGTLGCMASSCPRRKWNQRPWKPGQALRYHQGFKFYERIFVLTLSSGTSLKLRHYCTEIVPNVSSSHTVQFNNAVLCTCPQHDKEFLNVLRRKTMIVSDSWKCVISSHTV